ncbi:MAG: metallophosphoesterase family protein [Hyphomicrobiales bacterium]
MRLGLVADTHGYLGTDVLHALEGCDAILHAGDVGPGVLEALREIGPLVAVRGNNDTTGEAAGLPEIAYLDSPAGRIAVVHRLADAPRGEWDILVFGHCHRRHDDREGGRHFVNPGAAGRRGFHRERSVALLDARPGASTVTFVDLGPRSAAR